MVLAVEAHWVLSLLPPGFVIMWQWQRWLAEVPSEVWSAVSAHPLEPASHFPLQGPQSSARCHCSLHASCFPHLVGDGEHSGTLYESCFVEATGANVWDRLQQVPDFKCHCYGHGWVLLASWPWYTVEGKGTLPQRCWITIHFNPCHFCFVYDLD